MPRFHIPARVKHSRFRSIPPRIQVHARVYFRRLVYALKKEEGIDEIVALGGG